MSKKLQNNGLFESSRMILPEHREAYISQQLHLKKRNRPKFDRDEIRLFSLKIAESMATGLPVALILFREFGEETIVGKVSKIDQHEGKIKIISGDEQCWIPFGDIIAVRD